MTPEETAAALKKAEGERDEIAQKLEKAEKDHAELTAKVEKLEKDAGENEPEPEQIDKAALPEAVREALEKAERDAKDTRERLEKAEDLAKSERDLRVEREFVTKAETEYKHVPGSPTDLGPLLKRASENLPDEDFVALEKTLKAANEQLRVGNLLDEFGSSDQTPADGMDEVQRKAEEIRKSDPNVSEYQALDRAMRENREAQASYLASVR
jgi:hypothetical protein